MCGTPVDGKWTLDDHTGLLSWRSWQDAAAQALARMRGRRQGAVLFIDLDRFKVINDRHGHMAGDKVLTAVANVLRSVTRHGDLIGRYGGDEFVVLLTRCDVTDARGVARRIGSKIGELVVPVTGASGATKHVAGLSASIGMVPADTAPTLEGLLLAADAALLESKNDGRQAAGMHIVASGVTTDE
ncbi:GGDEF domain-containing protein [Actinosynnema sp. NPDC051121]